MSTGKNDNNDDMLIEYMAYKMATGQDNDPSDDDDGNSHDYGRARPTGRSGLSAPAKVLIAIAAVWLIVFLYDAIRPKCAYPGCDDEPLEGSHYCWLHRTRYTNRSTGTTAPARTNSKKNTPQKTTTKPASQNNKKKTTTAPKKDEYNAYEYYDAEDFYDEYYDDFYDFEDAEDYWDEHH